MKKKIITLAMALLTVFAVSAATVDRQQADADEYAHRYQPGERSRTGQQDRRPQRCAHHPRARAMTRLWGLQKAGREKIRVQKIRRKKWGAKVSLTFAPYLLTSLQRGWMRN